MVERTRRRELLVAKGWVQAAILVTVFGFTVAPLGSPIALTSTPRRSPPRWSTPAPVLFTGEDILQGQQIFLSYGLMEYGSVFGHGAYLGPDFTADYLHRPGLFTREQYGGAGPGQALARTIEDFKANRYDAATGQLLYSAAQAAAFEDVRRHYAEFLGEPTSALGCARPRSPIRRTSGRSRPSSPGRPGRPPRCGPGQAYSYTNNWPPEPLVGNQLTADAVVWSALSLIALLGGIGLLFAVFGRFDFLGWHGRGAAPLSFIPPARGGAHPGPAVHGLDFFLTWPPCS